MRTIVNDFCWFQTTPSCRKFHRIKSLEKGWKIMNLENPHFDWLNAMNSSLPWFPWAGILGKSNGLFCLCAFGTLCISCGHKTNNDKIFIISNGIQNFFIFAKLHSSLKLWNTSWNRFFRWWSKKVESSWPTTVNTHLSSDIRLITVKLLLACSFQGVLILFKTEQATVRGALSPV